MTVDTVPGAVRAASDFGTRPAVVDDGRTVLFGELADRVRRSAAGYLARGVRPGDRVCVWAPNRLEWMLAALGAQYVGAVLVPLNTRYKGEEAADVLSRTGARVLVVDQGFLGADHLGMLRAADAGLADGLAVVDLNAWESFEADAGPEVEAAADRVDPDDACDILFTSGTTGRSKGAVATHRITLASTRAWAELAEVTPDDRYLVPSPFFHSFGSKAGYLVGLTRGAAVHPLAVFDTAVILDRIEQYRITLLPGAPTVFQSMLDDPSLPDRDLSSLRLAVTGAASVPQVLVERMEKDLQFDAVLTAYGLTEAPVVTMCRPGDDARTIATTSGAAVDGVSICLGDGGEVLVRGSTVMTEYLDDPAATAEALDADGWLHTGDVGELDERGYLRITDRIKDMFTVGGFNVYPAEVEQVISRCPGVRECAVIGVADHRLGEVPLAFVAGNALDADAVIAFCRERLANFKVPRRVRVVDALPRNAGGKVVKTELREQVSTEGAA